MATQDQELAANNVGSAFGSVDTDGLNKDQIAAVEGVKSAFTPSPYFSSERGQDLVEQANQKLAKMAPPPPTQTDQKQTTEQTEQKTQPGYSLDDVMGMGVTDMTGWQRQGDGSYMPDETALANVGVKSNPEEVQANKALSKAKGEYESVVSALKSFDTTGDPALSGLTQGIINRYDKRIKDMRGINESREAAMMQTAIRGGTRYTGGKGGVWGSIISGEEQAGLDRIQTLEGERQSAIVDAKTAYDEKKWNQYVKLADIAEKKYKDQLDAVKSLNDEQVKHDNETRRDSMVGALVAEGVTDTSDIVGKLSSYGMNYTAKEISESLGYFTSSGNAKDLSSDLANFNYLKKANMLPESITGLDEGQQYFAFLNMQKVADSGKLGSATGGGSFSGMSGGTGGNTGMSLGKGAGSPEQESIIRFRVVGKVLKALTGNNPSDKEREYVTNQVGIMRNADMSENEIIDTLSGFSIGMKTPYNSSFRDALLANSDPATQAQYIGKVNQLMGSGNYQSAMNTVENIAMTNAKKLDPNNYMGSATATNYLKNIDEVRTALSEGGVTGFVGGNLQNVLGRIKGPKTAALKAKITNLVAQFRHDLLGSAVTESEKSFLSDLIPDISSSNFVVQLNAFQNGIMNRYNSTRSSVSLPEVSYGQALTPTERLKLYASDITDDNNPFSAALGEQSKPQLITGGDGQYEIPE